MYSYLHREARGILKNVCQFMSVLFKTLPWSPLSTWNNVLRDASSGLLWSHFVLSSASHDRPKPYCPFCFLNMSVSTSPAPPTNILGSEQVSKIIIDFSSHILCPFYPRCWSALLAKYVSSLPTTSCIFYRNILPKPSSSFAMLTVGRFLPTPNLQSADRMVELICYMHLQFHHPLTQTYMSC